MVLNYPKICILFIENELRVSFVLVLFRHYLGSHWTVLTVPGLCWLPLSSACYAFGSSGGLGLFFLGGGVTVGT